MTLKIALIGSAPSSVALAPYADESWHIWGCSPGARPYVKRFNLWFEMHLWEPDQPWFSPEYVKFMAEMKTPVMTLEPIAALPTSVAYPKEEMVRRYGPFFFTSTLSWMLAMAIEAIIAHKEQTGEDGEIGLWGVDMSAAEEVYTHQRAGCQFFLWEAMKRGIKLHIPHQSDLFRPTPLYGYCEQDPMHQKLLAREAELNARKQHAINTMEAARNEMMYLSGAAEDARYVRQTWVADRQAIDMTKWIDNPLPVADPVAGAMAQVGEAQVAAVPASAVSPVATNALDMVATSTLMPPTEPVSFRYDENPLVGGAISASKLSDDEVARLLAQTSTETANSWGSTVAPSFLNGA